MDRHVTTKNPQPGVDPEIYKEQLLSHWRETHPDFEGDFADAQLGALHEYHGLLGGLHSFPELVMMQLRGERPDFRPTWGNEPRRQAYMAENRRDGSNPPDFNPFAFNPLAGGTPDVMRRYNPNNLLPPETVERMKAQRMADSFLRVQQAADGVRPLENSDISIMGKAMDPDSERDRYSRDGWMNWFPGRAVPGRSSTVLPFAKGGPNYFPYQEESSAAGNVMMSGRGPFDGGVSTVLGALDHGLGQGVLRYLIGGHELGKAMQLSSDRSQMVRGDGLGEVPTADNPTYDLDANANSTQGQEEFERNAGMNYQMGQTFAAPILRHWGVPERYNSPAVAGGIDLLADLTDLSLPFNVARGFKALSNARAGWRPPLQSVGAGKHLAKPLAQDAVVDAAPAGVSNVFDESPDLRDSGRPVESFTGAAMLEAEKRNEQWNNEHGTSIGTVRGLVNALSPESRDMLKESQLQQEALDRQAAEIEARNAQTEANIQKRAMGTQNLFPAFVPKPY